MARLNEELTSLLEKMAREGEDAHTRAARAADVRVKWENAVHDVYGEAAGFILGHVNAVYVLAADVQVKGTRENTAGRGGSGTQLVVYADDSLVRSDLDAKQEFLKMHMNGQGEHVAVFHILPARFDMKDRHPFEKREATEEESSRNVGSDIDEQARERLLQQARNIEDEFLRKSFEKAIWADFHRCSQ